MALRVQVSGRIARPVHDVFEAVADPDLLSDYFTTNGAKGRLETGATVIWDFADFPGAFPVHVVDVEQDRRIVLRWAAADDGDDDPYETTVTMEFEPLDDGRTLVTIAEEGWRETDAGPGGVLRQLRGLDRDAVRAEGVDRARHQPARRLLQVIPAGGGGEHFRELLPGSQWEVASHLLARRRGCAAQAPLSGSGPARSGTGCGTDIRSAGSPGSARHPAG